MFEDIKGKRAVVTGACGVIGRWIAERLNQMDGPVRFFLPELGVSALDAAGKPFWDPEADAALFRALEQTVRQTNNRRILRVRRNINEPEFAAEIVVNPETDVVLEGTAIMGGYAGPDRRHARIGPDSPRVRVRGVAFWGGVSVTRRP